MYDVFTPTTEDGEARLNFSMSDIEVVSGTLGRGYGMQAVVKINGWKFQVIGQSCGQPSCVCDASIVLVD